MSFHTLFDSGFKDRNRGHFAALVRIALSDGIMKDEELQFLKRVAIRLDIDQDDYEEILNNPSKQSLNPPSSKEMRLERLFDLARMVEADQEFEAHEVALLEKICVGLGFDVDQAQLVASKALELVATKSDFDSFSKAF